MDATSSAERQPDNPLRTADELFARPECSHIVTTNSPSRSVHLERVDERFRLIVGPPEDGIAYREFGSLDEMYEVMGRQTRSPHFSLRDPIWQDITDYPAFSSLYSTVYCLLDGPVEVQVVRDTEHMTAQGPLAVYGPARISSSGPQTYLVTPTGHWLVVERPGFTWRGRGGRGILRPTRTRWERWQVRFDNWRLQHNRQEWTRVHPSVTVVYGKPPADWQSFRRVISAEGSVAIAGRNGAE